MSTKPSVFSKLESTLLYEKWNKEEGIPHYTYYCRGITMDQSIYYKIENLCNLLIRNLEDLHRNKYEEYYSNGSCKLLNDWLYEKVKTALGSCHIGNCKEILDNLHMAWKKYITGGLFMTKIDNKCKPETLIPNFQDIEDKKLIHEHCFNYYEISKKSTNVDECKSYKEYIKDASLRYGEFESLFAEDKANYGTYYEKCKSYNPINISTYSNCPNEIKISEASGDVATLSGQSSLEAGRERELREEEGHVSEGEERESGVRGVDGGDVRGDEERVESMEIIQSNLDPGVVMGSGLAHVEGAGYVDSGPSPSSVNNSSVMPVGLSLFGIASFSTILYKAITLSDLPSRKFDDLKERINYNILKSYQKPNDIENGRKWVSDFLREIHIYFSKKPVKELIKKKKDCVDFNYIIHEIKQKIYSLFSLGESHILADKIKKWHEQFFTTNHDLPCKQVNKYFRHELKELYDLCEDRNFIIPNQANIINTPDCQEIISNMNNRKNTLINERDMLKRQYQSNFIRGISCDLSILDNQFPSITCSSFDEPALKTEEDSAEIYPANTEVSGEETETVSTSSSGKLMVETNGQLSMTGEGESGSGTPSNTLNLFALPILGVLGCSFLLYKFTPVGSLFRPRIKNKGIIPINKDDYAAKQLLSNIPNINDTYSENTQYKISYQTL